MPRVQEMVRIRFEQYLSYREQKKKQELDTNVNGYAQFLSNELKLKRSLRVMGGSNVIFDLN